MALTEDSVKARLEQLEVNSFVGYFEYASWRVTLSMLGEEEGYKLQELIADEEKVSCFEDIGPARDAFENAIIKCIQYTSRSMVTGQIQSGDNLAADRLLLPVSA